MALLGWLLAIMTAIVIGYVGLHPNPVNIPLSAAGLLFISIGIVRDEIWWDQLRSYGLLLVWVVFAWTWLVAEGVWPDGQFW
jgi:hypothetical protein